MTTEQYNLLSQFALDIETSLREYCDEHGSLFIEDENLMDAITACVNMMHLIHEIPISPFIKKMVLRSLFDSRLVLFGIYS